MEIRGAFEKMFYVQLKGHIKLKAMWLQRRDESQWKQGENKKETI